MLDGSDDTPGRGAEASPQAASTAFLEALSRGMQRQPHVRLPWAVTKGMQPRSPSLKCWLMQREAATMQKAGLGKYKT